jgi:hypothetical protein
MARIKVLGIVVVAGGTNSKDMQVPMQNSLFVFFPV